MAGWFPVPASVGVAPLSLEEKGAALDLFVLADQHRWEPFRASVRFLAQRWGWSAPRTHRFLVKARGLGLLTWDVPNQSVGQVLTVSRGTALSERDTQRDTKRDTQRDTTSPMQSTLPLPVRDTKRDTQRDTQRDKEPEQPEQPEEQVGAGSPIDPIQSIYDEWRVGAGLKPQAITAKRRAILKTRIKSHGLSRVQSAIRGACADPWLQKGAITRFEYITRVSPNTDNIEVYADAWESRGRANVASGVWGEDDLPEPVREEAR